MGAGGAIALALAALTAGARAQAPGLEVLLRDGTVLRASSLTGPGANGFDVELADARRQVPARDVVAVLGGTAQVPPLPAAHLLGGDVLRGALVGGDDGGNRVDLLSPVLGRVPVAVDRVEALASAGVTSPRQLRLPEGVDEALFVPAGIGFDLLAGALHQFGEQGVRFQVGDDAPPRWYRAEEFAALRLRGAAAREDEPTALLLTRTGDRLGVTSPQWRPDGLACTLEGGTAATLRAADLACLVYLDDVVFLSDLEPVKVDESGFDGDAVHPFRRDHAAAGGPLRTGGRAYAKGLGVHSRSRLSFQVPAGCDRFWTRVGFDDGAAELGLEPRADVAVLVNDTVVFEVDDLAPGPAPRTTGLLAVRPGDTVTLVVEPGRGRDLGDRVDWVAPMFLPAAARRP